jgi:hypothetical protein
VPAVATPDVRNGGKALSESLANGCAPGEAGALSIGAGGQQKLSVFSEGIDDRLEILAIEGIDQFVQQIQGNGLAWFMSCLWVLGRRRSGRARPRREDEP